MASPMDVAFSTTRTECDPTEFNCWRSDSLYLRAWLYLDTECSERTKNLLIKPSEWVKPSMTGIIIGENQYKYIHGGRPCWGHRDKMAAYAPRVWGLGRKQQPTSTLIWGLKSPELGKNTILLLKPSNIRYLMTAWTMNTNLLRVSLGPCFKNRVWLPYDRYICPEELSENHVALP